MENRIYYIIIINFLFMAGFLIIISMYLGKLKRNIKNYVITFCLYSLGLSILVFKLNYKPDILDYFLLIWLALGSLFRINETLYRKKNKIDKILEEEKEWLDNYDKEKKVQ